MARIAGMIVLLVLPGTDPETVEELLAGCLHLARWYRWQEACVVRICQLKPGVKV